MGLLEFATACLVNLIDPLSDMRFWLWSKKSSNWWDGSS